MPDPILPAWVSDTVVDLAAKALMRAAIEFEGLGWTPDIWADSDQDGRDEARRGARYVLAALVVGGHLNTRAN